VRSLTVIEAKGTETSRALLDEYYKMPRNPETCELRWTFGNAFEVVGVKDFTEEIYAIILDKDNGKSRGRFIVFLGSRKIVDAIPILKKVIENGNLNEDDFSVSNAERQIGVLERHIKRMSKKAK